MEESRTTQHVLAWRTRKGTVRCNVARSIGGLRRIGQTRLARHDSKGRGLTAAIALDAKLLVTGRGLLGNRLHFEDRAVRVRANHLKPIAGLECAADRERDQRRGGTREKVAPALSQGALSGPVLFLLELSEAGGEQALGRVRTHLVRRGRCYQEAAEAGEGRRCRHLPDQVRAVTGAVNHSTKMCLRFVVPFILQSLAEVVLA